MPINKFYRLSKITPYIAWQSADLYKSLGLYRKALDFQEILCDHVYGLTPL
jgi:predicted transcriptional regulator